MIDLPIKSIGNDYRVSDLSFLSIFAHELLNQMFDDFIDISSI
jgi:hypothetical protein